MTYYVRKINAECSDYDFKEDIELAKSKSWLKTVCAYVNGIGGKIFFGISNDKKTYGSQSNMHPLLVSAKN